MGARIDSTKAQDPMEAKNHNEEENGSQKVEILQTCVVVYCQTPLKSLQVEDEEHVMKICPLYEEVRREFAESEFDRNVEEIVQDNHVSLVARFLTHYKAIRAQNILVV